MTSFDADQTAALRIAYLTEWSPYAETGVLRKLIGQIAAWRDLGCEAQLFAVAPRRNDPAALDFSSHGVILGALHQKNLDRFPKARLGFFNKIASAPLLRRAIQSYRPDVIYYRQNGPWYPGIETLLALAPAIMEINTNERAETRLWSPTIGALYRLTQSRVWKQVRGFICVTGELASEFRSLGKPVAVIGNSFWNDVVADLRPSGNVRPAFVFVGSHLDASASWHGVDKLWRLAAAMPESRFNVVGMDRDAFENVDIPRNIYFHGEARGPQLTTVLQKSDVGFGTLALHRKEMEEACPLKVREYLMNRLPVVIGYRETQEELGDAPYVLRIPNTPDNVVQNIDRIRQFAEKWTNRRVTDDLSFLSMSVIERRRIAFLREFAERRSQSGGVGAREPDGGAECIHVSRS